MSFKNGAAFQRLMDTLQYDESRDVIVLNHGDFSNSNMFFTPELNDVVLIDFQVGRLGSPNLDISNYLWTIDGTVRRENLQELFTTYFNRFNEVVQDLGGEVNFTVNVRAFILN